MNDPKKLLLIVLFIFFFLLSFECWALQLGLHMDLTWTGDRSTRIAAIQKAKEINAKISRNSFLWHKIEPIQGQRDWGIPDSVVEDLLSAGIEPLFCLYGSPSWANGVSSSTKDHYNYVPTEDYKFQEWLNNYNSFVAVAAARYKGKVKKWELWNEQNQHFFWKPKPNIDQYVRWFKMIETTIMSIDPNAEIAVGGLAGLCCSEPDDYNGRQFLTLLYQRGVFPNFVAIHPYSKHAPDQHVQFENNFDDITLIREVMAAFGQAEKKLWVTEWGWATDRVSQSVQANWLGISLRMVRDNFEYISLATYFIDYDRSPDYFHGLCDDKMQPKPASTVFRDFVTDRQIPISPLNLRLLNK